MSPPPDRVAAVLAWPELGGLPPPGVDAARYAAAMVEDTYEVVADMVGVRAVLAAAPPDHAGVVEPLAWVGTPVLAVVAQPGPDAAVAVLDAVAELGAGADTEGVVVAGDAPDLPGLLVAKLFAAFTGAEVAVCPCAGGGLVALGCRLPVPAWLRTAGAGLDVPDALDRLRAAAPRRGLVVGPGWHRLRAPADLGLLDPGLEGWSATRALLSGG